MVRASRFGFVGADVAGEQIDERRHRVAQLVIVELESGGGNRATNTPALTHRARRREHREQPRHVRVDPGPGRCGQPMTPASTSAPTRLSSPSSASKRSSLLWKHA